MEIRETVQRNVARYIKGSDYTQAEIARMLGVSKPTVTNWIKGVNTPNIEIRPLSPQIPRRPRS